MQNNVPQLPLTGFSSSVSKIQKFGMKNSGFPE